MDYILFIPILVSFFIVLFIMPFWIKKASEIGLIWKDMNKYQDKKVAGSGGIIVVLGFLIGILLFVAYRVFIVGNSDNLIQILASLLVVIVACGIGLIDDLLGWQKGGLSRRSRIMLVAISAIPLMAINAGTHEILGMNIGLLYAIILVPIGVIATTTTFNFVAGFNGLEAGMGVLMLGGLSFLAYFGGNSWLSIIGLCMCAALLGFLLFNKYPAKVFPGDVLTYAVGSLIGTMAILGNFEKIAIFFFIPVIIEVILKSRGKLVKHSFGKPNKDGTLELNYPQLYGLTHTSIYLLKKLGIKSTERNVVYLIWLFQGLIIILGFVIFKEGIFG